jgi:hypothetical protein
VILKTEKRDLKHLPRNEHLNGRANSYEIVERGKLFDHFSINLNIAFSKSFPLF